MSGAPGPARLLAAAVRGLRSRASLTVGSLLLATVALASAILGPAYQSAAAQSFLVTRLGEATPVSSGVSVTWSPPGELSDDVDSALQAAPSVGADALAGHFAEPTLTLESTGVPFTGVFEMFAPNWEGEVKLAAKDGACEHLAVLGACPEESGQALLLEADAALMGVKVGDSVPYPDYAPGLDIVGTYTVPDDAALFFFDESRLATTPPNPAALNPNLYQPAPLVVNSSMFAQLPAGAWQVHVDRFLEVPADITTDDVAAARQAVVGLPATLGKATSGHFVPSRDNGLKRLPPEVQVSPENGLQYVIAEIGANRETARNTVTPAVVSLVLVALTLLLRLLGAAADQRRSEMALASLRGMRSRQRWSFGLAEPAAILVLATPLGVALGYAATLGLSRLWLAPGIPVQLTAGSFVAGLLVLGAAAVASVVTIARALDEPLSSQLAGVRRPSRSTRLALVAQMVVVVAAAVVVVSSLTAKSRSNPDSTDLVLPLLLAVAAGLLTTAATVFLARKAASRTSRRRGIPGFVASRAVSRRREGALVILPLTAALAIAVFAAGVYTAAGTWRASTAATQVGADASYASPLTLAQTVAATHQLDPDAQWLMAAGVIQAPYGEELVLDTPRLGRVGMWPGTWTPGVDGAGVASLLETHEPPVTISGSHFALTLQSAVETAGSELGVSVQVESANGLDHRLFFGPYPPGQSASAAVPAKFCARGCLVKSLLVGGPAVTSIEMNGSVQIVDFAADGSTVDRFVDSASWRPTGSSGENGPEVASIGASTGGIRLELETAGGAGVAGITPVDVPEVRPVLRGRGADPKVMGVQGDAEVLESEALGGLPVRAVRSTDSMPFLGPRGILIDYTMMTRDQPLPTLTDVYVLARGDTPGGVLEALHDRGVSGRTDLAAAKSVLDQDAYALSLNLYLVTALAAIALALAGLAVNLAVQMPDRRRDAASLRVVGVRRQQIVRAVFAEICVVLGAAALAGIAAGSAAQYIVVRTVTLGFADNIHKPRVVATLDVQRLAVLLALVVALLIAVATCIAGLAVRRARAATLRESTR